MTTFEGWHCDNCGQEKRYGGRGPAPAHGVPHGWWRLTQEAGYQSKDACSIKCAVECLLVAQVRARDRFQRMAVRDALRVHLPGRGPLA